MANWATLKAAINNVIKTNNNQAITGQVLQNVLNNVVSSIGENYQFVDIATPTTNPGTPDGNVFYIAYTAGAYVNFNNITVNSNEVVFLLYKGSWNKKIIGLATAEELNASLTKAKTNIFYAICGTAANVVAKTVAMANFELSINTRFVVKMSYANTAASATLNVNNTGAKTLYYNGNPTTANNTWEDGETLDVYYDGTNYQASNVLGGSGSGGNMILEWNTDAATTRLQVKQKQRKAGMIVSYNNPSTGWVNEQYVGTLFTDVEWEDDANWAQILTDYKEGYLLEKGHDNYTGGYLSSLGAFFPSSNGMQFVSDYVKVKKNIPIQFDTIDNKDVLLAFFSQKSDTSFISAYRGKTTGATPQRLKFTPSQDGYIRTYIYDRHSPIGGENIFPVLAVGEDAIREVNPPVFEPIEIKGYENEYFIQTVYLSEGLRGGGSKSDYVSRLIAVRKGVSVEIYTINNKGANSLEFYSLSEDYACTYSVVGKDYEVNHIKFTSPDDGYICVYYNRGYAVDYPNDYNGIPLPYISVKEAGQADDENKKESVRLEDIKGVQDHSLPNLFDKNETRAYDSDFADKVFSAIGRKTDSTGCYSNNIECKEGDWFTRSDFGTGIVVVLDISENILGDVKNAAYQPTIQIKASEGQDFSKAAYVVMVVPLENVETEKIVRAEYMPGEEGDFVTIPKLHIEQNNLPVGLDIPIKSTSGRYYQLQVDDSGETPTLKLIQQEGIPMSDLPSDFPAFKTTGSFADYYDSLFFCPIEGGVQNYLYELGRTGLVNRYIKAKVNCPRVIKENGVWYCYGVDNTLNYSWGFLNIYKASGETFQLVKGNIGNSKGEAIEPHDCLVLSVNPLHYICQRYVSGATTVVDGNSKTVTALHVEEVYDGNSVWEWHSEDYPELWTDSHFQGNNSDYLHNNTICVGPDGNLYLNNKHANQILVIKRTWNDEQHTGTIGNILWKIGGNRTHSGWDVPTRIKTEESQQWFESHDAVIDGNGLITMFDNRNGGPSRIVEFKVDTVGKSLTDYVAKTFGQYRGRYMGSADRCAEGVYLVSWGSQRGGDTANAGIYDFNTGKAVFEIRFDATGSSAYRVYGIKKEE